MSLHATADGGDSESVKQRLKHWLLDNRDAHDAQRNPLNLSPRVAELRTFQARRLAASYADLRRTPRYSAAAEFFLSDLYGEKDFSERDRNVEKIYPIMIRLLPEAVLETVTVAAELNALSHRLDLRMVGRLENLLRPDEEISLRHYAVAYAQPDDYRVRRHQLALILGLGRGLDHIVRKRMVRELLALCHWPAKLAGLGALQSFLERGFDSFTALKGANSFLLALAHRERAFVLEMHELAGVPLPTAVGDGVQAN